MRTNSIRLSSVFVAEQTEFYFVVHYNLTELICDKFRKKYSQAHTKYTCTSAIHQSF